ncbi:unnamed protein product [Acanthoscelides obtectus]|uniref:Uncharacterized protein n=1 Tax=Acanthoscelides obtectus TaxID=200917 RepID=A0A9P0PYR8_ACAOB|nr:unnamed protein product [Acanthoscelides obtectus]CAK1646604.1 Coiled-coil domain-containing protein 191 [Acanthoscelides obtectus]
MQKAKIEEQNKIIAELELGIIREDLMKSIENTKTNIREIFAECSQKIRLKIPTLLIQEPKFSVCSKQAPKFVQQMEERAMIRARNREIILERKRFIEETRQKLLEEAIERKKVLEEEERKRNLEILKEKRKKEIELERIRQANMQIYLKKLNQAIAFHNRILMEQCFRKLAINALKSKEKYALAVDHHGRSILTNSMRQWIEFVADIYKPKFSLAEEHYRKYLLRISFSIWQEMKNESTRNTQVAEDYYEFKLSSNIFIYWHRYTCKQIMLEHKKLEIAAKHFCKKIVFHYFYQWKSLKMVLELERAKEMKKRKWREKVWEILPDYKPPIEF